MKTGTLWLGMVLVMLTLAGAAEAQLVLPLGGEDLLPATEAELQVDLGGGPRAIGCSGPTRIMRSDPVGGVIQTEIVQMSLSCSEGMKVREAARPSMGQIQASGDSFFDVFFEIDVPGFAGSPLRNQVAARVHSTIGHIPPLGSIYFGVNAVDLFATTGQRVGQLVHVKHRTNGVPKPESSGEVSRVFSCFYECKPTADGSRYQEVTTLMLLNQTDNIPLTADILFVNGNERPIARVRTQLSPLDLDELSVCHTLQALPAPVPPAGVIEVVLSPTGGAYGWVKNVLGSFSKTQPDPFRQSVKGIAKTQCRLVGPNVAKPDEILAITAPFIDPVLIEQTGE